MELPQTNLVILVGQITADPSIAELPSGSVIYSWPVRVAAGDAPATSVPVVAFDPPAAVRAKAAEDHVVVAGEVRRRFFRAGGITQSRTEVVAERIISTRQGRARAALVRAARGALDELAAGLGDEP